MVEVSFDIGSIARALNARAASHAIGQLQAIRKELKGLSRQPTSDIFTSQTIHPHYAFHHGGRTELQFNIGLEEVSGVPEIRHGVAFSFEPGQALPNIDVLIPQARLFSDFMQLYPERYADMRMWHYSAGRRSSDYPPAGIMPELVTTGTFVFLGKRQPVDGLDYEVILNDFDRLLPLYRYVESGGDERLVAPGPWTGFRFQAGCSEKLPTTTASLAEKELSIDLRHNVLQAALTQRLIAVYGADNVADEHRAGAARKSMSWCGRPRMNSGIMKSKRHFRRAPASGRRWARFWSTGTGPAARNQAA